MYPTLFTIGSFEVTSFGAMVALAAVVALWLFRREVDRSGFPPSVVDAGVAGIVGGLLGAKVLWTIEFHREAALVDLLFSRAGLSWFGGFLGGLSSGLWWLRRQRVAYMPVLAAATPALAVGHAIGRLGCFLVGDDYGRPSEVPWAVAFPNGRPPTLDRVHPTQLYEAGALLMVATVLLVMRRRQSSAAVVFGTYLVLAGSVRFVIEFLRVNLPIVGPFTLAQFISAAVVCAGAAICWLHRSRVADPSAPGAGTM